MLNYVLFSTVPCICYCMTKYLCVFHNYVKIFEMLERCIIANMRTNTYCFMLSWHFFTTVIFVYMIWVLYHGSYWYTTSFCNMISILTSVVLEYIKSINKHVYLIFYNLFQYKPMVDQTIDTTIKEFKLIRCRKCACTKIRHGSNNRSAVAATGFVLRGGIILSTGGGGFHWIIKKLLLIICIYIMNIWT